MPVTINYSNQTLTANLKGEIDHHAAKSMREIIDKAILEYSPKTLVLDFSEITFTDSSGVGLVMGRYRNILQIGADIIVRNTSPQIYKMFKFAGIGKIVKLENCAESTVNA